MTVRDAERLTTVDHREHEALAAIRPATDEIIGVARYIGLPSDPGVAEIAVAVVDDWQGQGIGRRLVTPLVERARENGFERLIAYVGPENRRVIDWLERHGAKHSPNKTGLVYTLELNTAAPLQRAA
jgi:RimJ/RimL family protein N-acetyltransferase